MINKRATLLLLALCALLVAALGINAFAIEPYRLQIEYLDIPLRDLPPELDGLRIAHIADLHIRTLGDYELDVQARLAELQPDMIVITGDLIEYLPDYDIWAKRAAQVNAFLRGLSAPLGVWASRGNTDITRYGGHNALLVEQIRTSGVHMLINEHRSLGMGESTSLHLARVDYAALPPGFSADHQVVDVDGHRVLGAEPCESNAYSHYLPQPWPSGTQHEFSGRFMYTDPEDGAGIVFASRQPLGEDRYLRLRRLEDTPQWHLAPKGVAILEGNTQDIAPEAGRWYRFRVQWKLETEATLLRARLWPEDEPEPAHWPIDCRTSEAVQGTIGFWSVGPGWKYWDDLHWLATGQEAWEWREDFQSYDPDTSPPYWLHFGVNEGNVAQALRGVPQMGITILLAHSPDAIGEAQEMGVDLVLSGHTHGGQVRAPIIGPIYINTELGREYNQGFFAFGETYLYVNRGIGTRGLPVRFLCPPEIALLTLRQQP